MSREIAELFGCRIVRATLVGLLLLLPISAARADVASDNPDGEVQVDNTPRLYFEPIAGLTTIRHLAPAETAIPLGTILELYLSVPEDAVVTFTGAAITSRTPDGVSARCPLDRVGTALVAAVVELSDGTRQVLPCRLSVLPIAIADISATIFTPTVAPFDLDESATNTETMAYFFGKSIARLVETTVGAMDANSDDGRRRRPVVGSVTRSFRTSIDRPIEFLVEADPQGFTPLMEWRVDGQGISIGAVREDTFMTVGSHTVSVGPPARSTEVRIDTYSVTITSHESNFEIVPEGELITFEAVTQPLGHEGGILWLSSTKYGTAAPVLGQGSTFTVIFDDTWEDSQWLGVRADNVVFNQDQKGCCWVCEGSELICSGSTNQSVCPVGYTFTVGGECGTEACGEGLCTEPETCDPGLGGCTEVHPEGGCNDCECTILVCDQMPTCCTDGWDAACVEVAEEVCLSAGRCEYFVQEATAVTVTASCNDNVCGDAFEGDIECKYGCQLDSQCTVATFNRSPVNHPNILDCTCKLKLDLTIDKCKDPCVED